MMEQMKMVGLIEGILKRCPCGGRIVDNREDGKRYFQC